VAIGLLTTAQSEDKMTLSAELKAGALTLDANLVRFPTPSLTRSPIAHSARVAGCSIPK
jgi:hypothetical protein